MAPVLPAPSGAPRLRLDVWEKGNISIVQLEEKLRTAARQALADAIMELWLLPAPLCTEDTSAGTWSPAVGSHRFARARAEGRTPEIQVRWCSRSGCKESLGRCGGGCI